MSPITRTPESYRILLVVAPDAPGAALEASIRSRGHGAIRAGNLESAWEAFRTHAPSIVCLDRVCLGEETGPFLARIREAPGGKECFVLALLPSPAEAEIRDAMEVGADDVLILPAEAGLVGVRLALAEQGVRRRREWAQAEESLRVRNREILTLFRISELTRSHNGLEEALRSILAEVRAATDFPVALLERLDPTTDHLLLVAGEGTELESDDPFLSPLRETLSGEAVERRASVALADARTHPRYGNGLPRRLGLRAYVAFPLVSEGRVQGVLTLGAREVREVPPRLLRWGESLAHMLAAFIERVEAEEALRDGEQEALALALELRRANEELEAFAYSVSHDLRAPLRTMQGFAHTLLREHGDTLPPQARDYIRRIVDSGRQSEALIRDLLAYSRMSFEKLELQEVELKAVVTEAREQVAADLTDAGALVEVDGQLPEVLGHRTTLVQIVANLLSNAAKFVPAGTIPHVVIRWEEPEPGQRARLWVEDNGVGIHPDQQERIFKVFERLEGETRHPGTGIGLAIVRRGMERMRGRVGVVSAPGEGSRFWLELPRARRRNRSPWFLRRRRPER